MDQQAIDRAVALDGRGLSYVAIGRELGYDSSTIGYALRPIVGPKRRATRVYRAYILRMRRRLSWDDVARRAGYKNGRSARRAVDVKFGPCPHMDDHRVRKLTAEQTADIRRRRLEGGESRADLAVAFDVSVGYISLLAPTERKPAAPKARKARKRPARTGVDTWRRQMRGPQWATRSA